MNMHLEGAWRNEVFIMTARLQIPLMTLLMLSAIGSSAFAASLPESTIMKKCSACHAINKKLVGPSFMDVSRHYMGNQEAPVILTNKIQMGGSGIWGAQAMPGQPVTAREARSLALYILGLTSRGTPVALAQTGQKKRVN